MELQDFRNRIDQIDDELITLFVQRMDVCAQIAAYKKENELPILMPAREQEKLAAVAEKAGPELSGYAQRLYTLLFELSRIHQCRLTGMPHPTSEDSCEVKL